MATACQGKSHAATPTPAPEPVAFVLAVNTSPDSTIRLAKFAMGTIDATLQLPQMRHDNAVVSTRYSHVRRGGGRVEIAVIAIVSRQVEDTLKPVTLVRLSAWALEVRDEIQIPQQRRGNPSTPRAGLTLAANQPRPVTPRDSSDWQSLDLVLQEFVKHGARRLP